MEPLLVKLKEMKAEVDDTVERLMGDEDFYIEYLVQLPDNENIVNLRKAVEEKDYERAKNEVHTLKGVAQNLGLLPLIDVCMDMLLDYRAGKPEEASAQLEGVEKEFQKWVSVIKEFQ